MESEESKGESSCGFEDKQGHWGGREGGTKKDALKREKVGCLGDSVA